MLRFANPEYFHLYWLAPLLILFFIGVFRQKKKLLLRLGDDELIARLTRNVSRKKQLWKVVFLLMGYCFLVLAMTDPQIGTKLEEVKREGVDIFIALDVSKSMLAEDVAPNRFERAKQEISNFVDQLRGDRVGLILFSGLAFVQCPLTLDYSATKLFLDESYVGVIPQPGTSVTDAIRTAMKSFVSEEKKHKVLIVITDGENHEDDPVEAAREVAESGVIIYTIGVGLPQGAPIPKYDQRGNRVGFKKDRNGQIVTTRLDVVTLERIAQAANGKFYSIAAGSSGLRKIYGDIMGMEKKELSAREFTQFDDRFQGFLLIALLFLIVETVLGERRKVGNGRDRSQR